MNVPSDTPAWFQAVFEELDVKARKQIVKPEMSQDRAAGYFSAVEDLRQMVEGEADRETAERELKRRELNKKLQDDLSERN